MRQPLDKALRKKLEETVIKARDIVEAAVKDSLQRLGVADSQAPSYLKDNEKALRNKLRAHARQLGDRLLDGKQEITRLTNEMAYEHWHRMLFARFLEQSNLLMYDAQTPVTLEECFELAEEEEDCKDGWELAGRLAQKMLPQIFRADSPVFEVKLSMNRVDELESLISKLDPQTYQAQDSLGWCYQFWQTKKKEEVKKSGVKIGAQELSPVTQLFTEPYMVSFLLDNALGAWWANKRLSQDDLIRANNEQELRELVSIPGVPLEYLRFTQDENESGNKSEWKLAAGGFEKWPEHLSELKTLDPCCGSGHFLVAVFLMLVPMRMQLEGLTEKEAVDAVLRDNIHGLELDQRCVELAAFALALEAWRYPNAGGYRTLPELQLACSGMSIAEAQKEWKDIASGDDDLVVKLDEFTSLIKDAPLLGSMQFKKCSQNVLSSIKSALSCKANLSSSRESVVCSQGAIKFIELNSTPYQWVVTNPPYLGERKQNKKLLNYLREHFNEGRSDLAMAFVLRNEKYVSCGVQSVVIPQNWLYQSSYTEFRKFLLEEKRINFITQLGSNSFESGVGADVLLLNLTDNNEYFCGIDATNENFIEAKKRAIKAREITPVCLRETLEDSDYRVVLADRDLSIPLLDNYSASYAGILNGDTPRFISKFWEHKFNPDVHQHIQSTVTDNCHYSGKSNVVLWENGVGQLRKLAIELKERLHDADRRGNLCWGKKGISISQMGDLPSTLYTGELFDSNAAVILPNSEASLGAIWCYCQSKSYLDEVRKIDKKRNVTNGTLVKVPFDQHYWNSIYMNDFPNGLPLPYSDEPEQWLFHGHPCASVIWDEGAKTTAVSNNREDDSVLQVAVARLLGYQWPAELDPKMELAPEMREVIKKNADFTGLIDDDGIVCIPAVRGEKSAAKRLEAMLLKAYGEQWDSSVETNLLKAVKAKELESWLRDKFFEQHCKLFQHRPFIWHIWDGLKDGFSALVNYHQLDYKGLERLIYTYLDDWISNQKRQFAEGTDGADIRLTAAENLKVQLEAILEGEEGLDIFVRWKPLEEQPIGWNPDLNDGVRLNIRPFMLAKDVGKKGAGVLRAKPNIHWKKDRGTDVESAPWYNLGLEYGGKQGDRINEHHLSLSAKRAAREQAND